MIFQPTQKIQRYHIIESTLRAIFSPRLPRRGGRGGGMGGKKICDPLARGGCGGFPHTPLEAFASLTLSVRGQSSECQRSESQKKGQLLNENRNCGYHSLDRCSCGRKSERDLEGH